MGNLLQTTIVFVLVLGGMIVIHEFGHFIVAKLFGIRVDVFSVGFGKRLFGVKKGDTDYRLSLIPLGGYVKMAGENLDEQTGAPYEFQSKPKWQRLCVAVAGPVMNILTAIAIPAILAMIHFESYTYINNQPVVNSVAVGSAAEQAGIQRGDLIVSIDGTQNPNWSQVEDAIMVNPGHDIPVTIRRGNDNIQLKMPVASIEIQNEKIGEGGLEPFLGPNTKLVIAILSAGMPGEQAGLKVGDQIIAVNGKPVDAGVDPSNAGSANTNSDPNAKVLHGQFDVIREIRAGNGQPITLTVKRGDETLAITANPKLEDGVPKIGFLPSPKDADKKEEPLSPIAALKHGVDENLRIIQLTKAALAQVFTGKRSAGETVAGPVGIAAIVGQAAEQGVTPVLRLMGMLSLNLGVFNLLPIPVLDGGLIFMIILEGLLGVFGLRLSTPIKERMMQVGMVMLMLLMGFVIFNDISKQFSRRSTPQAVEQPKDTNK